MGSQVKTKERVRQHGEVFTAEREVMAMMDLVKEDASNIDSTFFEPACGDGNFLAEILSRKMRSVFKVALSNDADCEYWANGHYETTYSIEPEEIPRSRTAPFSVLEYYQLLKDAGFNIL